MNGKHLLTTLTLGLALTVTSALAQNQQPVLSGSAGNLRWSLYGPGQLQNLNANPGTLQVSTPAGSRVVGAKYQNGSAILSFRAGNNTSLQDVYQFHDRQLTQQGFRRASQNLGNNEARAVYERGGSQVVLNLSRGGNDVYRANLDLTGVQGVQAGTGAGTTAQTQNTTAQNNAAQNTATGNPIARVRGQGGATYELYGPGNLNNLNSGSGTVRFSVPQGATVTDANVNANGDLHVQVTADLSLQQMMDFYDRQFRQQGFTLVNPTDTGAGLDNALTYIYERNNTNRVSFSVEREDNYRLVWDFQDAQGNTLGNNVPAASPGTTGTTGTTTATPATPGTPLFGSTFGGLGYDFYGPGYTANNLTPNAPRVSLGVPQGATNVQRPVRNNQLVRLTFNSQQNLRDVFNSYDRQFTQQGFQQTAGQLDESEARIIARYRRGNAGGNNNSANDVRLTVDRQGNGGYVVTMDFTPQS